MDKILKNKSVINFISVGLLFSTVVHRIADNGLALGAGADCERFTDQAEKMSERKDAHRKPLQPTLTGS
jgi:hypothetical protein